MPGEFKTSPIPIKENIIGKDGRPSEALTRYLTDITDSGARGTHGSVPVGTVVMFSGDITHIPRGWYLCNGENDTPNLVDRFIFGAAVQDDLGGIGGYSDPQMPSHTHTILHNHNVVHNHPMPHTHTISHTHNIAGHSHPMGHTHSMQHDHPSAEGTTPMVSGLQTEYTSSGHDGYITLVAGAWSNWIYTGNSVDPGGGAQPGTAIRAYGYFPVIDVPEFWGNTADTNTSNTSDVSLNTDGTNTASSGGVSTPNTSNSSITDTGAASTDNSGSTGSGDEGTGNLPPYYKLFYIIRMF